MYNKCDKCGKLMGNLEGRKLITDNNGKVATRCMDCYEDYLRFKNKKR